MNESVAKSPQTPTKQGENCSFSPIILPKSPAQNLGQGNLTGLPRVARDIAADVYNNIQKWNQKHIEGAGIVKQIALLKAESTEKYPDGVEELLKELYELMKVMQVYLKALIFLTTQMQSLGNLPRKEPLFISLTAEKLSQLVMDISEAYKKEFKFKEYVMENIGHADSKPEIMFFAASWVHQVNITNEIKLKLEILLTETGHRALS